MDEREKRDLINQIRVLRIKIRNNEATETERDLLIELETELENWPSK